jgi:hypothetical protein
LKRSETQREFGPIPNRLNESKFEIALLVSLLRGKKLDHVGRRLTMISSRVNFNWPPSQCGNQCYERTAPKPMIPAAMPKTLVGISVSMLLVTAVFGVLNSVRVKGLHVDLANAIAARDAVGHGRMAQAKEVKSRQTKIPRTSAKSADAESKAAKAEADLAKVQKEKADLETRLEANQVEIASLQKRVEEVGSKPAEANPGAPSTVELQAQLDDARRQRDIAEREKVFLSETIRKAQRSTELEEEKKRRAAAGKAGVRGAVLAANQAYNFVVLNLGGRQGVEPNSEMLVVRDGTLIGRIRISSVEPATAIGDIVTSCLARGVQVQPGDIVIYAGTNS